MKTGITGSTAGTLLLAILLLRGAGWSPAPQTDTRSSRERATSQREQSGRSAPPVIAGQEDGPWQASRQYFAGRPGDNCPSFTPKPASKNAASPSSVSASGQRTASKARDAQPGTWCIPSGVHVGAMIAIVPDPVHSHLSLIFDRTIESLQLAAEEMHYVVDRYWLPWRLDLDLQDDGSREAQPGLLLFRWDGAPDGKHPEVLYVFLVGDTSTTGINGAQFSHAVQYVQQVSRARLSAPGCGTEDRIWIMGPTFSGSLASLRQLTTYDEEAGSSEKQPHFSAYSGTVSSKTAIEKQNLPAVTTEAASGCTKNAEARVTGRVQRVKGQAGAASSARTPQAGQTSAPRLTFSPLLSSSENVVSTFLSNLKEHGDIRCDSHQPEVAIFSEAATTYGGAASKAGRNAGKGGDPDDNTKAPCDYTSFRFPREISSLRNASAAVEPQAASSAQSGTGRPYGYLPFNLADRQPNSSDEPPSFAREQGPLSQEAVLMKYAAELRRGHYKYVGIIATNIVDVLFLARFLRDACPDVRLFMLNADLLFERDLDNAPYIGTLSLSTYPLIIRGPDWISHQPLSPRLPFGDQYEEGQYHASLLVMQAVLGSSEPQKPSQVAGASSPAGTETDPPSPVWVTAVGTGGYWPVQLLGSASQDANSAANKTQNSAPDLAPHVHLDSRDFSPSWRTLALALASLALFQAIVLCTAAPVGSHFREFSLLNAAPAQRFFFLNVTSASLAFTLAILAAPAWKFGMGTGYYVPIVAIACLIAAAVLFAASLYLGFRLRKISDEMASKQCVDWSMIGSAVIWVAAAAGAWFWRGLLVDDGSHYGFFFAYRAVNLATGVSPLAPMLLLMAAVFLWSIFEIWRLRFDDRVRPRLHITNGLPGGDKEALVAATVNKYLLGAKYIIAFFILLVGWLFSLQPIHPFQLFEKTAFGRIYELLFCVVVALMISTGLRLTQTWSQLHDLLQELERSPIRHAFSRLKEHGWSPIWQAGGQEQQWTYMVRSFEVMQQIGDCSNDRNLCDNVTSALEKRDQVRNQYGLCNKQPSAGSFMRLQQLFSELQYSLALVLHDVWSTLQSYWKAHSDRVEEEEDAEKNEKAVIVNCSRQEPNPAVKNIHRLEEYVALRYVAFIRETLAHLRLWLILEAAVFSLVLLSLNVYSFEPHRSLIWSFTALFVLIGVTAIQVLIQAHRDPIISRITGTQPNKLELQFYVRIATLGVVPLLTLLATHFPSVGKYLLSLLQPGMEALK